jgi:hypothetical protein
MTALFDGEEWSTPAIAPIPVTVEREEDGSTSEVEIPVLVSDGSGWVHALWLEEPDEETGEQPLMHSQMPFGSTT